MITRRTLLTGAAAIAAYAQLGKAHALTPQQRLIFENSKNSQLPNGFYNFTGSNLSNYAAALAGAGNVKIGALTDSTGVQGGTNAALGANSRSGCWPVVLAGLLSGGNWSNFFGDDNVTAQGATLTTFDTRLSLTNWVVDATGGLSGFLLSEASPNAGALAFTPIDKFDTIEIWYAQSAANGSFTVDIGGAILATINTSGANALVKTTVSCALGNNTVNIKRSAGGTVFVQGANVYNSTIKSALVYDFAACGWTSANFIVNTNPWDPLNAVVTIAPNLVLFEAGIVNDWNAGSARATVTANQKTVVNALKAINCDVIMISAPPSNPSGNAAYAVQTNYVSDMKAAAYVLGIPFIDVWGLFGGVYNAALMDDGKHPNHAGHVAIAGYVSPPLIKPTRKSAPPGPPSTVFSATLNSNTAGAGYTLRNDIQMAAGAGPTSQVRVTFQSGSGGPLTLDHASIGVGSGSAGNTGAVPSELKFGGASGFAIGASSQIVSDWLALGWSSTDRLVVIADVNASLGGAIQNVAIVSSTLVYHSASASYNLATAPGGSGSGASTDALIALIETR